MHFWLYIIRQYIPVFFQVVYKPAKIFPGCIAAIIIFQRKFFGSQENACRDLVPIGRCIFWFDGSYIFYLPIIYLVILFRRNSRLTFIIKHFIVQGIISRA